MDVILTHPLDPFFCLSPPIVRGHQFPFTSVTCRFYKGEYAFHSLYYCEKWLKLNNIMMCCIPF